ncbi:MAG: CxxxxCH/CxxCH domain c-type cytochrome [Polyangiaceae bacterium]
MALITLLALLVGCSEERTAAVAAGGVHPPGWGDRSSAAFHATWLSQNAFPLPRCQECHGNDYLGGDVGVSCVQSGCHTQTPIACTTCHGSNGTPRPQTGAHWAHEAYCSTCHDVPVETTASVQAHASADASTLIDFSGLAVLPEDWLDAGVRDAEPAWNPTAQHCTNTYCHGPASPQWTTTAQIQCNGCHEAPPADHAPWSRVASSTATCTTCHPSPSGPTHVNGVVDVTVTSCTTCHGSNGHANPPLSLDGSTDPTTVGVGAHEAHLDPSDPNRIVALPLLCNDCHAVPTAVVQPGHFNGPQAIVRFPFGGTYDPTSATCNVWCHFNKTPGPVWTDNTGDAIQCDSCHAFPPVLTRAGDPHPSVPSELSACLGCHPFESTTHVNGVVDFVTP